MKTAMERVETSIACILDSPSVYMGGPSPQSRRRARRILEFLGGAPRADLDEICRVAQLVEQGAVNALVEGSSPSPAAKLQTGAGQRAV